MAITEYLSAFFENVKKLWQEFDLKKWAEQVGGSSAEALEAAAYFGICFSIGFFCKKYFKLLLTCITVSFLTIKVLEYGHFVVVDWDAIKLSVGITETTDFNMLLNIFFDWVRGHLLLFISSSVGFLVGYKLG